jgi:hypothetical protein
MPRDGAGGPSECGIVAEQAAFEREGMFNPFCATHFGVQITQIDAQSLNIWREVRQSGIYELDDKLVYNGLTFFSKGRADLVFINTLGM